MTGPPVVDLALEGVTRGDRSVLGAISLRVLRGEAVALTGPSGIGKTTLLRVIAGLESYDGTCRVTGRLACVFQEPALLPWRSLTDNICLTTGVSPDLAEAALQSVGLGGRGHDFPGQLSLGQQRRVALARAFAVPPDLLLLDEPFVSLDPDLAEQMMDLLRDLIARHGPATLLVTHSAHEAEGLAQRIERLEGRPATLI